METGVSTVVVRSFAKVNFTLDIGGRRVDGFHDIESVMQTVSLHDVITLNLGGQPGIRVFSDDPSIPTDERNLAYKAATAFTHAVGLPSGLDIRIEKRIPVEAGLGGGSSNAAAVLRGLNALLGVPASRETLMRLAAEAGSDVPFFVVGGLAHVASRGESVCPLPDLPECRLVIVKPLFGVSTAWAYRRLDEIRGESGSLPEQTGATCRMLECIRTERCARMPALLSNDLEAPALERHPVIGEIRKSLLEAGARGALMCGSGSAVFGLFKNRSEAENAAGTHEGFGRVFICETVLRSESTRIDNL